MNCKIIFSIVMLALLGLSALVSAEGDQVATAAPAAPAKRQSIVKSCEAKTKTDCKTCCEKDGLQAQLRGRCVCSRFYN